MKVPIVILDDRRFQNTEDSNDTVDIPILAFTDKVPVLREEYETQKRERII